MVYITGVTAVFLLFSLREESTLKQQFQWLGFHMGVFAVEFVLYLLISSLFFLSGSVYLENQIAWSQAGMEEVVLRCVAAVANSLKNNPPYYTGIYGVFSIVMITLTIYRMAKVRRLKSGNGILFLLAELFLVISPYIFIFFYGGPIRDRMQLVMPFSQGVILYLIVVLWPKESLYKTGIKMVCARSLVLIFVVLLYKDTVSHLNYCNRFYYTYDWAFQYDARMAEKLYYDIREEQRSFGLDDSYDNILFVGYPDVSRNASCHMGEVMGTSFFRYDIKEAVPYRYRILSLMRNLGYPVECHYTDQEISDYRLYFEENLGGRVDEMPCYPDSGYIRYLQDDVTGSDYLVIKLGEIWRYDML